MASLSNMASTGHEQEEALESCMARRRNLEQIFQALSDGIIAVNCERRVFHQNPAAPIILGLGEGISLIGEEIDELLSRHTDQDVDFVSRTLESREAIGPKSLRISVTGEAPRRVTTDVRLLRDDTDDAVIGAVIVLHDESEIDRLRADLQQVRGPGNIVGSGKAMQQVFALIREVARTDATVLVEGETGTGKELVANAIHELSDRADGPMVTVNCAALPEGLLESELFGHVRGSFTGAVSDRAGRFELAAGGTLFLDEVGEIPQTVQVKLLRVLQERTYERVGEGKPRRADVRLISATNKTLADEVAAGRFRDDLFYRLNVFPITLPPLRERVDDLPLLTHTILERLSERSERSAPGVDDNSMAVLQNHGWPGNVRELQAAMEYALIRSHGETIEPHHLPQQMLNPAKASGVTDCIVNEETILLALESHGGNKTRAAESLGISRVTLWRKMRSLGLA
jgi:transcriptional regulator with PAS, ATPase and Fis domain